MHIMKFLFVVMKVQSDYFWLGHSGAKEQVQGNTCRCEVVVWKCIQANYHAKRDNTYQHHFLARTPHPMLRK